MKLKRVLLNIAHELKAERFEMINAGGCCFFAAVLAKELEKRKIPFTFIMRESMSGGSIQNYIDQSNNKARGYSAWHVYLKTEHGYFDSEGFYDDDFIQNISEYMIEFHWNAEQIKNYNKNGEWNNTFLDYSPRGIKREIKEILRNNFKQYDTKDSIRH